ncbi:MAG TPA: hypothetical protein VG498_25635 [Terriglobales bacterium]|nr:hypothetical protein [Terriglobales bacterium]
MANVVLIVVTEQFLLTLAPHPNTTPPLFYFVADVITQDGAPELVEG